MSNTFHLAILAGDLDTAIDFYCDVLGCTQGMSEDNPPDRWCDINLGGNELTLHASCGEGPTNERHNVDMGNVPVPHFGIHFEADEFKVLKEKLIQMIEDPEEWLMYDIREWITYARTMNNGTELIYTYHSSDPQPSWRNDDN